MNRLPNRVLFRSIPRLNTPFPKIVYGHQFHSSLILLNNSQPQHNNNENYKIHQSNNNYNNNQQNNNGDGRENPVSWYLVFACFAGAFALIARSMYKSRETLDHYFEETKEWNTRDIKYKKKLQDAIKNNNVYNDGCEEVQVIKHILDKVVAAQRDIFSLDSSLKREDFKVHVVKNENPIIHVDTDGNVYIGDGIFTEINNSTDIFIVLNHAVYCCNLRRYIPARNAVTSRKADRYQSIIATLTNGIDCSADAESLFVLASAQLPLTKAEETWQRIHRIGDHYEESIKTEHPLTDARLSYLRDFRAVKEIERVLPTSSELQPNEFSEFWEKKNLYA